MVGLLLLRTILKMTLFSYSWGYCYQEFVPLSLFATCKNENVFFVPVVDVTRSQYFVVAYDM